MDKKENGKEKTATSFSIVEKYRLILGLELHGGVPSMEELPDSFSIPAEILKDVASARQQTIRDGTKRFQSIDWKKDRYIHGKVYQDNLRDALPAMMNLSKSFLRHKALLYWRTDKEKTSFDHEDIGMALMFPGYAFIHALATPDDIHLMVQTKKSAQMPIPLPIMDQVPMFRAMIGYPSQALDDYDLGGIAKFLQKRGFGMYQLTPGGNILNPVNIGGTTEYRFQRITP